MDNEEYLEKIKGDDADTLEKDAPFSRRRIGNIELRYDSKGEIDEILLHCGNGLFHMERMDGESWWFGLDDDENALSVHAFMMLRELPTVTLADWPDEIKKEE